MDRKFLVAGAIALAGLGAGSWLLSSSGEDAGPMPTPTTGASAPAPPPAKTGPAIDPWRAITALEKTNEVEVPRDLLESYDDARICYFNAGRIAALEHAIVQCESFKDVAEFTAQYDMCSTRTRIQQDELSGLKAETEAACGSMTKPQAEAEYARATREAAEAGVADAQVCYVESIYPSAGSQESAAREYEASAPQYVRKAFQRGDWRIPALLARLNSAHVGLLHRVADNSYPIRIRMLMLLRRGADGDYAKALDSEIAAFQMAPAQASGSTVTPAEAIQAEQWADAVYRQFYRQSPQLAQRPQICSRAAARDDPK